MSEHEFNEPELPDNYPIYGDYLYVADGKVVRSNWHGITAARFKREEGVKVLCRCDIAGRQAAMSNELNRAAPDEAEIEP